MNFFLSIFDILGMPATLSVLLKSNSSYKIDVTAVPKTADASRVIKWHEWLSSLEGHISVAGTWHTLVTTKNWTCDIQDITALYASKSELNDFENLDQVVETNSQEMIDSITLEKLHKDLEHKEIRIIHSSPSSDYLVRYSWDKRILLSNAGGSHHFAAARYIAKRIAAPVPITGDLEEYSLNLAKIQKLVTHYNIYAVLLNHKNTSLFYNAINRLSTSLIIRSLPQPYDNISAVFIPKHNPKSVSVNKIMKHYDLFNLGSYLLELARSGGVFDIPKAIRFGVLCV